MAKFWKPPPPGVLKINVHGTASRNQSPNGYYIGIGAVYRDSNGDLKHLTLGVIPELTPLGNQLWAIFAPLRRAFELGYRDVFLKIDNLEAFLTIKNFNPGAPAGVFDIASQIYIRIHDERWSFMVAYVYAVGNRVARFLSSLGKKVCEELYTFNRAIGGVEKLLALDMGMGFDDPNYHDVVIPMEAPDPVDFDVEELPSDLIDNLGLGQENAPGVVVLDREVDEVNNLEEVMMEELFQGELKMMDGVVFAGDVLLVELA